MILVSSADKNCLLHQSPRDGGIDAAGSFVWIDIFEKSSHLVGLPCHLECDRLKKS